MKLRIILNLAALSFACSSNLPANTELEPVKLQLKWTHQFQFAGYYAAQEQGYGIGQPFPLNNLLLIV